MVVVLGRRDIDWNGRGLHLTLSLTDEVPPSEHVTAAHCLGFADDGRFLLARHVDRQWTIPGGHLEPGEQPEMAMRREAMEEAAAVVTDPRLLAVERIDLVRGERDPRYPDPAFQVFYLARVAGLGILVPNAECVESGLFPVAEARRLPGWMDHNRSLFQAALDARRG